MPFLVEIGRFAIFPNHLKRKESLNKNSQIPDKARHCFHYQKKTYEQVIELKDGLIARQQSEKQSVSKYTRWQQLKVGLPSVKHQNININCKNRNEIFRQPR